MALHTVLGAPPPPWGQTVADDGDPSITLCSMFYLTTVTGWSCVGGRIYIPDDARVNGQSIAILAWSTPGTPVDLSATADRAVGTSAPPAGGWVEVEWAPLPMEPGTWIGIGYQFIDTPDLYIFTAAAEVGTGFVQASDGSTLYLAETGLDGGRSRFRQEPGATTASTAWYGTDIVVDDGATSQADIAAPWSFGATVTGERESSADIAAPWSFGTEVTGSRVSSGSVDAPWSFGADVTGERMSQADITAPWAFGATVGPGEVPTADVVAPWSFGVDMTGTRPDTGLTPTVAILQTLRDILDLLTAPGACQIHPEPCRTVLSPGLDIAWDSCGDSCGENGRDGQLWANITTMEAVTEGGGTCERITWTADVGIVRCAATLQEDGSPPAPAAEEHDAWQQAADADMIRYAIRCCPTRRETMQDLQLVNWTALGPSGGCVGGAWTISGVLEDCCGSVPQFARPTGC